MACRPKRVAAVHKALLASIAGKHAHHQEYLQLNLKAMQMHRTMGTVTGQAWLGMAALANGNLKRRVTP